MQILNILVPQEDRFQIEKMCRRSQYILYNGKATRAPKFIAIRQIEN